MRIALLLAAVAVPASAIAQDAKSTDSRPAEPKEPDKPVTGRDPSLGDAVATPATDLNLKKDAIPPLLLTAQSRPYDLAGLRRCSDLAAAVTQLDSVLGPDIDLPIDPKTSITAGRVAQAAVGAFIPFRGLIRELSGANEQDRKIQVAIQAGFARRAYLKGVGEARGCRYPARAVSPADIAALAAPSTGKAKAAAKPAAKSRSSKSGKGVSYVSEPVIQQTKK